MSATVISTAPTSTSQSSWIQNPAIYEINTWVWLGELSRKHGRAVTLSSVPREEWDALAEFQFEAVWLMGVWERSPAGIAISNRNRSLIEEFKRTLPDFRTEDNVGSPYCIRRYVVDEHLGGTKGLTEARSQLGKRGMKLVLDFVPNHVAPDHPWVISNPEFFLRGTADEIEHDPTSFLEIPGGIFACGRDPFFPAWPDVLQVNAFNPGLREAAIDTLSTIAAQCDGVRCDMAMLLLNSIFERTWGNRAGARPASDYWTEVIAAIKRKFPQFLFVAEAYWDLEWELQQNGFNFCYDKRLYDRLQHDPPESVRLHLCADMAYQRKLLRFLENHDEPRAAAMFQSSKERAAAITIATIPGIRLFHEGQLEGRKVKLPVFLSRRPEEPVDGDLQSFYRTLLKLIHDDHFHAGDWTLCDTSGWPDNQSCKNLVAWSWSLGEQHRLIVVNLSDGGSQGLVQLRWPGLPNRTWRLCDRFSGDLFVRGGNDLMSSGLYVELRPWAAHFLECVAQG